MRFLADELFALEKLSEAMPKDTVCYVHGSRVQSMAKGGDIDLIIESNLDAAARWDLGLKLSLIFKNIVDEKLDIMVLPFKNKSIDENFIFSSANKIFLEDVLVAPRLDHVAVLVNNLERSIEFSNRFGFGSEKIESFEAEGTRECYIGEEDRSGRLLLIQAESQGPYLQALNKRGAGLHHICFSAKKIEAIESNFKASKWKKMQIKLPSTIWFSKKNGGLLELCEKQHRNFHPKQAVVEKLELPFELISVFGEQEFLCSPPVHNFSLAQEPALWINHKRVKIRDLAT